MGLYKMMMMNKCPFCGDSTVYETTKTENFLYGVGDDAALLSAEVIVRECSDTQGCNGKWTDYRAEDARQAAVEKLLSSKFGIYLCVICREVPVDVENGYDTCDNCIGRV